MQLALEIAGFSAILIFIFIGIWSFILFNKTLGQLKYQNYLLEKLIQSFIIVSKSSNTSNDDNDEN